MIVDTGPLVAAANRADPYAAACRDLLQHEPGRLVVPALVVAEAGYLIERDLGPRAEAAFVRSLSTNRYEVVNVTPADLTQAAALIEKYDDLPLGVTDATLIAIALRRGEMRVATLDRRHLRVVEEIANAVLLPDG